MFIEIEGADACGKSTLAGSLAAFLTIEGKKVLSLNFPDHESPTGRVLRGWLGKKWTTGDKHIDALAFQCLQIVNRLHLLPSPGTEPGQFGSYDYIVCDRYYTSGLVYGVADGLDWDFLIKAQERLPQPDISFHMRSQWKRASSADTQK